MKRITIEGKYLVFEFPFSYELKDKVKGLFPKKMNYNEPFEKKWSCRLSLLKNRDNLLRLQEFCSSENFELPNGIQEAMKEEEERTAELGILSSAEASDYEVEGLKMKLRPYQKAGVEYMVKAGAALNADEQRLGKSGQTIAAIHKQNAYPALVICKSSLMYNWKSEIEKWIDGKVVHIQEKTTTEIPPADYVIINPEKLAKLKDKLVAYKFSSIVYDEVHNIGNKDTQKYEAIKAISKNVKVKYGLSGTPVRNRAVEMTQILDFLGYLRLWSGKWGFIKTYYDVAEDWTIGHAKDLDKLHNSLRSVCMVRRTMKDVLQEVPITNYSSVTVELSPSSEREYFRITTDLKKIYTRKGTEIAYSSSRASMFELRRVLGVGKIDSIKAWVEDFLDSEQRLVLFAHHIDVQNGLADAFPNSSRIIGADSLKDRDRNLKRFQNGETNLIVCSLEAAGEGLDLSASDNIGFCELGMTPVKMDQAISRIKNVTKTNPLFVYSFVAKGTLDMRLVKMLEEKAYEGDMVRSGEFLEESYAKALMESLDDL